MSKNIASTSLPFVPLSNREYTINNINNVSQYLSYSDSDHDPLITIDPDLNMFQEQNDVLQLSKHLTVNEFNLKFISPSDLSIVNVNIRSVRKKLDKMMYTFHKHFYNIFD